MKDSGPRPSSDELAPRFQLNGAVFKMLAVCAMALGLPIAVAVLGFWGIRDQAKESAAAQGAPIADSAGEGLRNSLESIAEEKLPSPRIDSGTRRFVFEKSDAYGQTAETIREILKSPDAVAISTDDTNTRWIVKVPSHTAQAFDWQLAQLHPVQLPSYPIDDRTDNFVFYEINLVRAR
jgi:hypothetical protein